MKRSIIGLASLALLLFSSSTALADDEPATTAVEEPEYQPPPPSKPQPRIEPLRVSGGLKVGYVSTRGFDTFADSNTLPQFSLDATYTLITKGRLALAAGFGWDIGGRGDKLRGLGTSLTAHRFLAPIEARFSVLPWLWAFGKVAPGAALVYGRIEDPSSPNTLSDSAWAFATDLSAGATFAIGKRQPERRGVRVLVTPEIGYALTTAAKLRPSPDRDEDELLGADSSTNLQPLALSGFFWRTTIGIAF